MATQLDRFRKIQGDGSRPEHVIRLEDWNGLLDEVGSTLSALVKKGADFDAVAATAISVLLDRINGVLGPLYDDVSADAAALEARLAQLNGQGIAAESVQTSAARAFVTAVMLGQLAGTDPNSVLLQDGSRAMTGALVLAASGAGRAAAVIPAGSDPTAPATGWLWSIGSALKFRLSSSVSAIVAWTNVAQSFSALQTFLSGLVLAPLGADPAAPVEGQRWTRTGLGARHYLGGIARTLLDSAMLATTAQAQAGTATDVVMNPARTADAISALALQVGDYLTTARAPGSSWLKRDGSFYTVAGYPALAALIPYASRLTFAQSFTQSVGGFNAVAYSSALALWVAVGNAGAIYTSPDRAAWTARSSGTTAKLSGVYWAATLGIFVAVGAGGVCIQSTDGQSWAARASGTTNDLNAIFGAGNNFVAVGNGGVVRWSASASGTLTTGTSNTTANLLGVALLPGVAFVAVGTGGVVITTADLTAAWTVRSSGTTADLYGVRTFGSPLGGPLVYAYGASGALTTSADATAWMPRPTGSAANLRTGAFIDGATRLFGDGGVVLTSKDLVYFLSQGSGLSGSLAAFVTDGTNSLVVTNNGASPGVGTVQSLGTTANDQFQVPSDDAARGYIKALAA